MEQNKQKLELLETSCEMIDSLVSRIEQAVTLYHGGKEAEGSQKIIPIIDDLEQLMQAMTLTADVQVEKVEVFVLNDFLTEIVSAFENQDYVLLADLFEYEVSPVLQAWKEKILVTFEA
ncbi:hypothetical protein [Aneurinibacillus danicus]|uniref:DUF8042 domain-containing protein n=1 Tax=Aneurinibacillus danicus TaxID=267746 RepID=A0A511V7W8_9BACL|nr:hypothetical protein [Aneurinibacillus danicus]GEN35036.1 hypothetical protein ADA01nite_24960 [Aneurinibacillus danicus]